MLPPTQGVHSWISSIDLASLYPSTIRSLNISPETIVGQFLENAEAFMQINNRSNQTLMMTYETGNMEELSASDWRQKLIDNNWCLSGYGTVFSMDKQGFVPALLTEWYNNRKAYKKKMFYAKDMAKKLTEEGGSKEEIIMLRQTFQAMLKSNQQ